MSFVGKSFTGRLNSQLAAGRGTFVDDVLLPGMTFMAVLRSPHAHARIRSIDTRAARSLPGVVDVVTGQDVLAHLRPIPGGHDPKGLGAKSVNWYSLCVDRARFVGEAVAAVVAEDKYTAYQALGHIDVDYEVLPAVTDVFAAL